VTNSYKHVRITDRVKLFQNTNYLLVYNVLLYLSALCILTAIDAHRTQGPI